MVKERVERFFTGKKQSSIHYRWVDLEEISPNMGLAVVAAEDQLFPHHWGFDFESIREALERQKRGGRLRGASTITQQVAKNLFLWTGRSVCEKGSGSIFYDPPGIAVAEESDPGGLFERRRVRRRNIRGRCRVKGLPAKEPLQTDKKGCCPPGRCAP